MTEIEQKFYDCLCNEMKHKDNSVSVKLIGDKINVSEEIELEKIVRSLKIQNKIKMNDPDDYDYSKARITINGAEERFALLVSAIY